MFRKSLKLCKPFGFLLILAAYMPAVPALAASINFTDPLFSDCDSQTSCEKTVGDVKIRIEGWKDADPKDGILNPLVDTPAPLYWKSVDDNGYHDGFGVKTGEIDEIERPEFLVVRFLNADDPGGPGNWHYIKHMLSELNITNLFNENGYLERGAYKFTVNEVDGDWVAFLADAGQVPGSTNGVLALPVPTPPHSDEYADYITFTAPEPGYTIPNGQNFEFSLAGLNAEALYTLSVSRFGTGSGTVTSSPPGINCGLVCTKTYDNGTVVALTATPDAGSTFSGWTGDCDGSGHVTINSDKSCTATFTLNTYTLTINAAGTGSGTTTGAGTYNSGQTATVSATANTGSTFTGWTGPNAAECGSGSVLMNADKSCTANFTLNTYTLALTTAGTGSGTVNGAGTYNYNQTATVSASANTGSTFTGWTGPNAAECGSGSVLMNADKSCTANFTIDTFTLTITTTGSGSGTVNGTGTYNYGQIATVSAIADIGSYFIGWTGPDAVECGTGSVLMNGNKSCTAKFDLPGPPSDAIADLVLCQTNFTSKNPDAGLSSTNAVGCNLPFAVAIDRSVFPNHVYISDFSNNRVLGWANESALTSGAPADIVFGQPDFTSNSCNQAGPPTASTLCGPRGIAVDSAGNLYVVDQSNGRVAIYFTPFTTDTVADQVIGQPNLTSGGCSNPSSSVASATSLCVPTGIALDASDNVFVADFGNNRVAEYNTPLTTDAVADLVIGQANFTTLAAGTGAAGLKQPYAVTLDANGNLYVADFGNNRVLEYNASLGTGMAANRVFGQANFTATAGNRGSITPSAITLYNPMGLVVDGNGNLYVVDRSNNRVLEYNTPLTTDATADRVFGQTGFTTSQCNKGGLGAGTFCLPSSVAIDTLGDVWVVDYGNNRAFEFAH